VISSTRQPLSDKTQHSQEINIYGRGGIRTRNPSNRGAATHALDGAATGIGLILEMPVEISLQMKLLALLSYLMINAFVQTLELLSD
jgi:hypothetical protein